MSDCQVVRDDHVACNNNINKNSATSAPQVRPSDEDNSYAMAIRNSSPIAPDLTAAATFSDSCDDDGEGDDEDDEVTDQEPFGTADDGEALMLIASLILTAHPILLAAVVSSVAVRSLHHCI